jgi:methylated-DNA-[protein]-cysteine S-methyltransferase
MPYAPATARIATPIGMVELVAEGAVLISCKIGKQSGADHRDSGNPALDQAVSQMRDWFAGKRRDFDLPLAPSVSEEGANLRAGIAAIPYGETLTYGTLGESIGTAARAVGQACKTNPFPIIIPCHRVTSAAGPEYYSAGDGPRTKSWLLDFEYAHLPPEKRTRLI